MDSKKRAIENRGWCDYSQGCDVLFCQSTPRKRNRRILMFVCSQGACVCTGGYNGAACNNAPVCVTSNCRCPPLFVLIPPAAPSFLPILLLCVSQRFSRFYLFMQVHVAFAGWNFFSLFSKEPLSFIILEGFCSAVQKRMFLAPLFLHSAQTNILSRKNPFFHFSLVFALQPPRYM
jgi:hypothetical protein